MQKQSNKVVQQYVYQVNNTNLVPIKLFFMKKNSGLYKKIGE